MSATLIATGWSVKCFLLHVEMYWRLCGCDIRDLCFSSKLPFSTPRVCRLC